VIAAVIVYLAMTQIFDSGWRNGGSTAIPVKRPVARAKPARATI